MPLMAPTPIAMANRGNTVTNSNTVAATTLTMSIANNSVGVNGGNSVGGNVLMVAAIAIYTASVTVSSITPGANLFTGWTFQGASTEPGSGVRIELWTTPCVLGAGTANSTINFSSAALASVSVTSYTEPYDYPSSPLVNSGLYNNTNGITTGVHVETISPAAFTAGNLIIVSMQATPTPTSVTDSVGTTYTLVNTGSYNAYGANLYVAVFAGIAAGSSASPTVTMHFGASSGVYRYYVSQWAGVTATVDTTNAVGVPSLGGAAMNTINVTTTNANDLIHTVLAMYGGNPTVLSQYPGNGVIGSFEGARIVNSTGTYPTYWTNNNSSMAVTTAFKVSPTYTPTAAPTPRVVTAHSAASTGFYAELDNTPQYGGNMMVTAYAVATNSGDTFAGAIGTLRTSVTPTVTSAAAVLIDNGPTSTIASMRTQLRMSSQRAWAAISFELVAANGTYTLNANPLVQSNHIGQSETAKYQVKSTDIIEKYMVPSQNGSSSGLYLFAQALASATLGIAYSETIFATGGSSPYALTVLSGTLPPGLSLNSGTGVISGTPTTAGTYGFTLKAIDSLRNTTTCTFQILTIASTNSGFVN